MNRWILVGLLGWLLIWMYIKKKKFFFIFSRKAIFTILWNNVCNQSVLIMDSKYLSLSTLSTQSSRQSTFEHAVRYKQFWTCLIREDWYVPIMIWIQFVKGVYSDLKFRQTLKKHSTVQMGAVLSFHFVNT